MSLAHLNVRSLNISDKLNEIAAIVGVHDFDELAFTETWLNPKISNDTLMLSGYHPPPPPPEISLICVVVGSPYM